MRPVDRKNIRPKLELEVDIYNIYGGANPGLLSRSRILGDYEDFVERFSRDYAETRDRGSALSRTIASCRRRGVQEEIIEIFAKGADNMIFTKFNLKEAKEVWQEEAEARGVRKGNAQGMTKGMAEERLKNARAMKAEGLDPATIARITGLTPDDIRRL